MNAPLDPWLAWTFLAMALAWCFSSAIAALWQRIRRRR